MDYFKHESAYVDEGAKVGRGTRIWHFCHVMAGAEIGENCTLGQNVFVAKGVRIGNGVKIQNNVSVYEGVVLEDDVFVGPSAVFTNVRNPRSPFPRNRPEDYLPTLVRRGQPSAPTPPSSAGSPWGSGASWPPGPWSPRTCPLRPSGRGPRPADRLGVRVWGKVGF